MSSRARSAFPASSAARMESRSVRGYDQLAPGHLPAAWQVQTGAVDCCLATRAVARVFGLNFIPLVSERYDLVIRKRHLELPRPGAETVTDCRYCVGSRPPTCSPWQTRSGTSSAPGASTAS